VGSGMRVLFLLATAFVVVYSGLHADYVRTPFGWINPDCIHRIPDGSALETDIRNRTSVTYPDGVTKVFPTCKYPYVIGQKTHPDAATPLVGHGWQAYTTYHYPKGIGQFLGSFNVPSNPPQEPGIIYIFTGLQNINWIPEPNNPPPAGAFDIIQPVLEYTDG